MKIYFLKDLSEDCVDAVIIAKESSRIKIEESIMRAKQKHEDDYQWEHLVSELPSDCEIYDKWTHIESIYY